MNKWYIIKSDELYHHGVPGQKWGVRNGPPYPLNLQFFANKAKSRKTIRLSKREYAHVISELMTNITKEDKNETIIEKAIGDYIYTFVNNFDDTYRIIRKKKIPQAITGLLERIYKS